MSWLFTDVRKGVRGSRKNTELCPTAAFQNSAAYRLNLVVNNLNSVEQVRNPIGIIKVVVTFSRENTKRRPLVPNVPLFFGTRWSAKHKTFLLCLVITSTYSALLEYVTQELQAIQMDLVGVK